jgi:hypothetical protein
MLKGSPPPARREQLVYFLLIGCLSMLYAELFSGASKLWFFNAWSLLVTFPLYMVHVIFFLNLAFKTHKTSIVHLYLWGTLFGMYESWITQVLWIGYNAEGPMIGTLAGIGVGEFLALVFFWHPVLAFVLPVLVFEGLAFSSSDLKLKNKVIPSHLPFLIKTKFNKRLIYSVYIIGSIGMAFNYQGNMFLALAALLGTYIILYVLYRIACNTSSFSVYSLQVKNFGIVIMIIYLIGLYTIMFVGWGVYGGRIPSFIPVVTTIILYFVFIWIILFSNPSEESVEIPSALVPRVITPSFFGKLAIFNICAACGFCFIYVVIPSLVGVLFMGVYLICCVVGVFIFYRAFKLRNNQTKESLHTAYKKIV